MHSISNTKEEGPVKNQIAAALVERIVRAARDGRKFKASSIDVPFSAFAHLCGCKVVVVIPEVPAFSGDVKSETSLKTIMAAQYRTINRGGNSIYEEIRKAGYEPCVFLFGQPRPCRLKHCTGWITSDSTTFASMIASTRLRVGLASLLSAIASD